MVASVVVVVAADVVVVAADVVLVTGCELVVVGAVVVVVAADVVVVAADVVVVSTTSSRSGACYEIMTPNNRPLGDVHSPHFCFSDASAVETKLLVSQQLRSSPTGLQTYQVNDTNSH